MARVSKKYTPPEHLKPHHAPAVVEPADEEPHMSANGHDTSAAIPTPAVAQPDAAQMRRAIADNVWLHFTQMDAFAEGGRLERPTVIVRGQGSHIWDADGKEYIDGLAGLFCVNVGYGRTEIVQAMLAQLEQIHFVSPFSFPNVPGTVLAERLATISPTGEGSRTFFVTGGSEAVETALKVAKAYQRARGFAGRYKTISRRYAYHGTTMGALSVTGLPSARNPYEPLVPGARHVPIPHPYRCAFCQDAGACTWACADEVERTIEVEGPESVAAIIMEPVQNSGGCIVPPDGYYQRIRDLCDHYGILLIMDEVITGFGRTGAMFGTNVFNIQPDIITVAKGLTSAYAPLGAAIVRREVAEVFAGDEQAKFQHGITFGGSPVAAAAALANLDILEREDLSARSYEMGEYLKAMLRSAIGQHLNVGEIRGRGLFVGIELVRDRETRESLDDKALLGWVSDTMKAKGLICRADDRLDSVIQLAPPLTIERADLDHICRIITDTLDEMRGKITGN
ncbi:MAG TPA: aminotransferase class III-fold pyridoxal phosphate-dependent enzyme [Thermomicrobiales bacterium]